ncbi:transglycosylase SLT domain protein [Colletotrichum scovillei]|nr:transglycosylase SLT domain protein [Colletotrichum scovillei]
MPLPPRTFLTTLIATAIATGDLNPDAQHAYSPTQGGQDTSFLAIQESTCNADEGGPTPGLMQCDSGNCQNGKSSCQYPLQDQVDCGAWVLRSGLDRANGNAVRALGAYNGWFTAADQWGYNGGKGLTLSYPCSDEGKSNGVPQNLDYLHQTLNGWFQGLDIYGKDSHLGGKYNCQQNCNDGLC